MLSPKTRSVPFRPACQTPFADPCADDMSRLSVRTPAGPRGGLVDPVEGTLRVPDRSPALVPQNAGHAGFYEYYRIGREDRSLPVRSEPPQKSRKGELRTVYESSHSPFGIVWQIASATGWSVHYILWKVNFQTLAMMLADAPHYRSVPAECTEAGSATGKTDTAQLFQSKLNLQ